MIERGSIVSYHEMIDEEQRMLQAGMHFRPAGKTYSIVLMSTRRGAPYPDIVTDGGKTLLYVGHDIPRKTGAPDPRSVDQQARTAGGTLTQNGRFCEAVHDYKDGRQPAEVVRVYEKIRDNIWTYNGVFLLEDYTLVSLGNRRIFQFKLVIIGEDAQSSSSTSHLTVRTRMIPSNVKRAVWTRDGGQCRMCGAKDELHFDHILPYSKGGSSTVVANVQILCSRHNLQKSDRIQ